MSPPAGPQMPRWRDADSIAIARESALATVTVGSVAAGPSATAAATSSRGAERPKREPVCWGRYCRPVWVAMG